MPIAVIGMGSSNLFPASILTFFALILNDMIDAAILRDVHTNPALSFRWVAEPSGLEGWRLACTFLHKSYAGIAQPVRTKTPSAR